MGPTTRSSALATTAMVSIAFLLIGGSSIRIGIDGAAAADGKIAKISEECEKADCTTGYFCMGFNKPEEGKAMANEKDKCNVAPSTSNCDHAWVTFKRVGETDEFDVELIGKVGKEGWVGVGFDPNGHTERKENEMPFGVACLTKGEGDVKLIHLPEGTGKPIDFMPDPHKHISFTGEKRVEVEHEGDWAVCTFRMKLPLWQENSDGTGVNTSNPIKYTYDFYTNPKEGVATDAADGKGGGKITEAAIRTDSGMPNDDLSRLNVNSTGTTPSGSGDGTTTPPGGGSGSGDSGASHLALLPGLLIFGAVCVISFSLSTHDP